MPFNKDLAKEQLKGRIMSAIWETPRGLSNEDILQTIEDAVKTSDFPNMIFSLQEDKDFTITERDAYKKAWVCAVRVMMPFFELARDMMKAHALKGNEDMENMTLNSDWLIGVWETITGTEFSPDYYRGKAPALHRDYEKEIPLSVIMARHYRKEE